MFVKDKKLHFFFPIINIDIPILIKLHNANSDSTLSAQWGGADSWIRIPRTQLILYYTILHWHHNENMASNWDDIPFLGFLQLFIKDVELRFFITDQR